MHRRDFLALLGVSTCLAAGGLPAIVCTADNHPARADAARRLPLFLGIGAGGYPTIETLFDVYGSRLGNHYHAMWMPSPPDARGEIPGWCADSYPFSAANTTGVHLVATLGSNDADLLLPLLLTWRARDVPVDVIGLVPTRPLPGDLARRVWAQLKCINDSEPRLTMAVEPAPSVKNTELILDVLGYDPVAPPGISTRTAEGISQWPVWNG